MTGENDYKLGGRVFSGHRPERVLMIQPGALGDSVLSLAVAGELARRLEGAGIEMLGHMDYISILAGRSAVSGVADMDTMPLHHLFGEGAGDLPGRLAEYLGRFDGAVSWLGKAGSVFERNLRQAIPGPVVIIDRGPPQGYPGHVVGYWLGQLFEKQAEAEDCNCSIELSEADTAAGRGELSKLLGWDVGDTEYVVFQPGAGSEKKCWPIEDFAELVGEIGKASGIRVVYLLGPAEQERFGGAALGLLRESGEVISGLDIVPAAVLIKHCRCFLGHDSGPTHLAAALSVPTVGIFGPTDPANWRPLGPVVRVLGGCGGEDWRRDISAGNVRAALEEAMSS